MEKKRCFHFTFFSHSFLPRFFHISIPMNHESGLGTFGDILRGTDKVHRVSQTVTFLIFGVVTCLIFCHAVVKSCQKFFRGVGGIENCVVIQTGFHCIEMVFIVLVCEFTLPSHDLKPPNDLRNEEIKKKCLKKIQLVNVKKKWQSLGRI